MGVRYQLLESNTTDFPTNAAQTFNRGFNTPGGNLDELIFRITTTVSAGTDIAADFSNIINQLRIVVNGSTAFDFRSGYSLAANDAQGCFGYFLNSLGNGRSVEPVPNATAKEYYARVPIGLVIPQGISRVEYTLAYSATATGASTAGSLQVWARWNSAMATQTTVVASTSFTHAASEETVVVRVPRIPGTLQGILVQNDSAADELNSIRLVTQSDFSIDPQMWRTLNGDAMNSIMFADAGDSVTELQFAQSVAGSIFIPTYGLTLDSDVYLQVDSSAATTRTYTPVVTAPVNSGGESMPSQTVAVQSNVAKSILAETGQEYA